MTKKHFIALAAQIKNLVSLGKASEAQAAADVVCNVAAQDNARFDRNRFLLACGLTVQVSVNLH